MERKKLNWTKEEEGRKRRKRRNGKESGRKR
jgi:hypothetical protein